MVPGPMFAVTVAKGYRSPSAGVLVALGHALVEVPLMLLVYFGLATFFERDMIRFSFNIAGGAILLYMGAKMFKSRGEVVKEGRDLPYNSIVAGVITSLFNPLFLLWWATIGAALIIKSAAFGLTGFALLVPIHWLCDLLWLSFVSLFVYRTRHLWGKRLNQIVFTLCSLLLVGFGVWFILSGVLL